MGISLKGIKSVSFKSESGDIFSAVKKIGDYGRAFKVIEWEVASALWPSTSELTW